MHRKQGCLYTPWRTKWGAPSPSRRLSALAEGVRNNHAALASDCLAQSHLASPPRHWRRSIPGPVACEDVHWRHGLPLEDVNVVLESMALVRTRLCNGTTAERAEINDDRALAPLGAERTKAPLQAACPYSEHLDGHVDAADLLGPVGADADKVDALLAFPQGRDVHLGLGENSSPNTSLQKAQPDHRCVPVGKEKACLRDVRVDRVRNAWRAANERPRNSVGRVGRDSGHLVQFALD
mmetsp:Transcript_86052/g.263327  ORF Transcript_86052/g.263327 Transcript_86052/m.263327 type:complete len:238 (-) Transcript_86052:307-1020(-)